jgi:hypothetical protein
MSFTDGGYEANPSWQPWSREQALQVALARLPPSARAKYESYVAAVTDAEALMAAALQRSRSVEDKFQMAIDRVDRAERAAAQGGLDANAIAKARAAADAVRFEYQAVAEEQAKRRGAHGQAAQTVVRLDAFLLNGVPPCRACTVMARPQDGESLQQAITRVRAAIDIAQREVRTVRSAPLPAATIASSIRDQIRELAAAGMPHVTIGGGDMPPRIEWPDGPQLGALGAASLGATKLFAAMFPERLEEVLLVGVDGIQGIDPADRAERLERLGADVLQLEHEEEALVQLALAKGLDGVGRRGDTSGWVLLGVEPIPLADLATAAA